MIVTAVGGNNAGLNDCAATFALSTVIKLIGRPHMNVFNQEGFIPPKLDVYMKLMVSPNNFLCKSAAPGQRSQQENYKFVIQSVNLIIRTKKLTRTANCAIIALFVDQNMIHHYSRVQLKHLSISANLTSINVDNVYTGALLNLVIVDLVSAARYAGGFERNPLHFQKFWREPH